ncbi:Uu.00g023920.m01.CDS01 [Anthostomella pinea]|uniref:Uu.00g023920.m01.CDS01 n=1 Tax=Anthostomella pinea TaxID=933095 RepID=A0AAI8W068_9PEZI|nr:Uu.00g023920.m01.CDS01 [Anthostomella pinea]
MPCNSLLGFEPHDGKTRIIPTTEVQKGYYNGSHLIGNRAILRSEWNIVRQPAPLRLADGVSVLAMGIRIIIPFRYLKPFLYSYVVFGFYASLGLLGLGLFMVSNLLRNRQLLQIRGWTKLPKTRNPGYDGDADDGGDKMVKRLEELLAAVVGYLCYLLFPEQSSVRTPDFTKRAARVYVEKGKFLYASDTEPVGGNLVHPNKPPIAIKRIVGNICENRETQSKSCIPLYDKDHQALSQQLSAGEYTNSPDSTQILVKFSSHYGKMKVVPTIEVQKGYYNGSHIINNPTILHSEWNISHDTQEPTHLSGCPRDGRLSTLSPNNHPDPNPWIYISVLGMWIVIPSRYIDCITTNLITMIAILGAFLLVAMVASIYCRTHQLHQLRQLRQLQAQQEAAEKTPQPEPPTRLTPPTPSSQSAVEETRSSLDEVVERLRASSKTHARYGLDAGTETPPAVASGRI